MPLTKEQIDELLAGDDSLKPLRKAPARFRKTAIHYPKINSKYIKFVSEHPMRCHSKGCGIETWLRVFGLPYCCLHAFSVIGYYIEELENKLITANAVNAVNGT